MLCFVIMRGLVLLPAGILASIPQAADLAIPDARFDLRDYGGKSGGDALNTRAFEAAVAAIRVAGGGELYVPQGVWLTTGFALTSNMSLFLESGATVLGALPNNSHWRPRNEVSRTTGSLSNTMVAHMLRS